MAESASQLSPQDVDEVVTEGEREETRTTAWKTRYSNTQSFRIYWNSVQFSFMGPLSCILLASIVLFNTEHFVTIVTQLYKLRNKKETV